MARNFKINLEGLNYKELVASHRIDIVDESFSENILIDYLDGVPDENTIAENRALNLYNYCKEFLTPEELEFIHARFFNEIETVTFSDMKKYTGNWASWNYRKINSIYNKIKKN